MLFDSNSIKVFDAFPCFGFPFESRITLLFSSKHVISNFFLRSSSYLWISVSSNRSSTFCKSPIMPLKVFTISISVFCSVYRNTQKHFIKDSLISFSLGLLYPFAFYFISSSLRICAISDKGKKDLNAFINLVILFHCFN